MTGIGFQSYLAVVLVLALTPANVSMLVELNPMAPPQNEAPAVAPFEQELKKRT